MFMSESDIKIIFKQNNITIFTASSFPQRTQHD